MSYKALQLLGCTDDINIVGRTKIAISEVYEELRKRAKEVGLKIVEKKMVENRKTGRRRN
jgi:GTPase